MEVIATSVMDYFTLRDPRMKGETYLWMVPIYAVVPYIYVFLTGVMTDLHWSVKGLVYMIAFYLLELIAGLHIKALVGVPPWNYEQKKYNLWGVICLDYGIVWISKESSVKSTTNSSSPSKNSIRVSSPQLRTLARSLTQNIQSRCSYSSTST